MNWLKSQMKVSQDKRVICIKKEALAWVIETDPLPSRPTVASLRSHGFLYSRSHTYPFVGGRAFGVAHPLCGFYQSEVDFVPGDFFIVRDDNGSPWWFVDRTDSFVALEDDWYAWQVEAQERIEGLEQQNQVLAEAVKCLFEAVTTHEKPADLFDRLASAMSHIGYRGPRD